MIGTFKSFSFSDKIISGACIFIFKQFSSLALTPKLLKVGRQIWIFHGALRVWETLFRRLRSLCPTLVDGYLRQRSRTALRVSLQSLAEKSDWPARKSLNHVGVPVPVTEKAVIPSRAQQKNVC